MSRCVVSSRSYDLMLFMRVLNKHYLILSLSAGGRLQKYWCRGTMQGVTGQILVTMVGITCNARMWVHNIILTSGTITKEMCPGHEKELSCPQ